MYINLGLPGALRGKFDKVFRQNLFRGQISKSGYGSTLEQTHEIALALRDLISRQSIQSVPDFPCGDLQRMSNVVRTKNHVREMLTV